MPSKSIQYWLYGLPGLPLAAVGLPLYIYLPTFYAEQLGMGLSVVGVILLIARITDVVSDPLIGLMADWLPFHPKRKWLIAIATPLLLASVWALFRPPETVDLMWLLTWSVLIYFSWSLITLPYTAWGAELSSDYDDRSTITAHREGWVLVGTLIAAGVPWWLGLSSQQSGEVLAILALLLIIILPVAVTICLRWVNQTKTPYKPLAFSTGLALLKQNTLFQRLLLAYLINGIANGVPATLFLLFVSHVLLLPDQFGMLLSSYFIAGLMGLPLGIALSKRFNKHRVWSISMVWAAMIFMWVPLLNSGDFVAFLVICLLSGLSLGIDMALPASIQADVIDLDNMQGGGQRAGFFFGLWGMTTKLSLALAVGIAFPLLAISGFDVTHPSVNNTHTLALMYGLLPIPFKLLAAWMMWHFSLGRQQQAQLNQRIEATIR